VSTTRLCFGTSTFVAGRLRPDKDSEPGIRALLQALSDGLDWVHSNPALRTQWAVRAAWQRAGGPALRHAVKVECPLDADTELRFRIRRSVEQSREALDVPDLQAAVIEIDLKGTEDLAALVDPERVAAFYRKAAGEVLATGVVAEAYAYCHSAPHMSAALTVAELNGLAAQFSPAEPWPRAFFPQLKSRGLPFFGMAPLWRGRLTAMSGPPATAALGWVLSHPEVTRAVLTMSSADHWKSVIAEASQAYDLRRERSDFAAWGLEWPIDA
jgi:aryl-alcohol dehydrogenase-like predicted oxidoreductase